MPERLPPVRYELTLSEDTEVAWQVTRIHVSEALNEPYQLIIDARTEAEDVDSDKLLGCDAALSFGRGLDQARTTCGLVARVDFLGVGDPHLMVRLHVVPAAEVLRQGRNSRIWQQTRARDIVQQVLHDRLRDYGRDFDLDGIERETKVRDYCVQYRESDFDFVSRLLEEEGISYTFSHDADAKLEILTLRDANEQYERLGGSDEASELPIITSNPGEADVESIQEFEWTNQLGSTSVLRRDFDWQTPRHLLSASDGGGDERKRERRHYAHGARRYIEDDLDLRAKDQRLASALRSRTAHARSNVTTLRPGVRFRVVGHYRLDLDQEYLVTKVEHRGAEVDVSTGAAAGEPYVNEFECVPFDAVFRPVAKTPKPREHGPQTALVTGPESEDIHTDEYGRIQVQFYWQEDPSYAAESSCWIRCSQTWAGMGWGAQFIPRVGMEVVVEFLEGDPDRPLVTGCVYNTEHMPPFSLPEHKTQSGWRSESTPGGGGSNELRFEDAAGAEEIYLHGEKNWTIAIEHDKDQTVGHDERLAVANDRAKRVGHDESFAIGHDQTGQVGNNQMLTVACNQVETIGLSRTDTIGVNALETVGLAKSLSVGTVMDERVGTNLSTSVGANHSLSVGGDAVQTVGGDKSVSSTKLTVESRDAMSLTSAKTYSLEVSEKISIKGDDKVIVEAAEEMVFQCGDASITLKKDGKIQIKGKDVTIKGSGNVVIKGQQVAEN